ncbi:hypothetical protein BDB01DRAFT_802693 [Pilobolus umbonatus]|nr:hypothetical protein BDB01DRAFT_802693 [Pilobolus umbonatus]
MSTVADKQMRSAASLIIAAPIHKQENGSNYRVLMVKRNARSSFINAHVYPGGVVDQYDHYSNWSQLSDTVASEEAKHILTNKICAIRETFEESGLLLSHPPSHAIKDLDVNIWRHKVHDDASQFKLMCDKYKILPAVDQLVPFSNWITPTFEKRRYDTMFFLTVLEYDTKEDQEIHLKPIAADGKENVLFDWLTPQEALDKFDKKEVVMIPPQWYSLQIMSGIPHFRDLLSKAGVGQFRTCASPQHLHEIIAILPQIKSLSEGTEQAKSGYTMLLAYPGDELYDDPKYKSEPGNKHRLYFKGKMQEFLLERNIDVSTIVQNRNSHW